MTNTLNVNSHLLTCVAGRKFSMANLKRSQDSLRKYRLSCCGINIFPLALPIAVPPVQAAEESFGQLQIGKGKWRIIGWRRVKGKGTAKCSPHGSSIFAMFKQSIWYFEGNLKQVFALIERGPLRLWWMRLLKFSIDHTMNFIGREFAPAVMHVSVAYITSRIKHM